MGGVNIIARIDQRVEQLSLLLAPLSKLLIQGAEIRLEEGILVVPRIEGEDVPPSVKLLQEQINQRLPQVGIVEIIREVDTWVNYCGQLREGSNCQRAEP